LANQKTPYILMYGGWVFGGKGDQGSMPLARFTATCKTLVESQST